MFQVNMEFNQLQISILIIFHLLLLLSSESSCSVQSSSGILNRSEEAPLSIAIVGAGMGGGATSFYLSRLQPSWKISVC